MIFVHILVTLLIFCRAESMCDRYEIVYYAPWKEKTWTVHTSCKLSPEPKARVANTRCGLANFTPVDRILFFVIVSVKPLRLHSRAYSKHFTHTITKTQFLTFK